MEIFLLEKKAIEAALSCLWEEAIAANKEIIKIDSHDIRALNRLARAYWEIGSLDAAKLYYQKVLVFDQYNPIATKNLARLIDQEKNHIDKRTAVNKINEGPPADIFLEEPGKTKVLKLWKLASPEILAQINCADRVDLILKKHFVLVNSLDGIYLGCLPQDVSARLIFLIDGGNRYEAFVKAIDRHNLEIFVKEIFRCARLKNLPSFSTISHPYFPTPGEEKFFSEEI